MHCSSSAVQQVPADGQFLGVSLASVPAIPLGAPVCERGSKREAVGVGAGPPALTAGAKGSSTAQSPESLPAQAAPSPMALGSWLPLSWCQLDVCTMTVLFYANLHSSDFREFDLFICL